MLIQRIKLGKIMWAAALDAVGYVIRWAEDRKAAVHIEADAWPATAKHYDGKPNVDKVNLVDGKKTVATVTGTMPPPAESAASVVGDVCPGDEARKMVAEIERLRKENSYLQMVAREQIEGWKEENAKLTEENGKLHELNRKLDDENDRLKADLAAAEELKGEAAVVSPPVSPPKP